MAKQYLKNYPKSRLLGIAHEAYANSCTDYDTNNITKYCYPLIKHPSTGEYALEIEDTEHLPSNFLDELVSYETMETNGWFETVEA